MTAVRRLRAPDAALWRAVRLEALAAAPSAFGARHEDEAALPLEAFAARLERTIYIAALEDGRAIGTLGLVTDAARARERHRGQLIAAYVASEARGRGVLDALLAGVLAEAPKDLLQLELEVTEDNARGRAAYARLGFVETGRTPRALRHGERFLDRIQMVRFLDAPERDA